MSDAFEKYIGRSMIVDDVITASQVHKLNMTLNRADPIPQIGDPVPPGWHHIFFPNYATTEALGGDGMVPEIADGPPDPLPIRMFAGSEARFHQPLRIGDAATQERKLISMTAKEGRSGKLVFAKYAHTITGPNGLCTEDDWNLVFMEGDKDGSRPPPPGEKPPENIDWERTISVNEAMSFRFSAVTFNPHRIHYDVPYTKTVEGYPGLVVNGPFTMTWLLELARDNNPGRAMLTFAQRAKAPLFVNQDVRLVGVSQDGGAVCDLYAVGPDGNVTMEANATFS